MTALTLAASTVEITVEPGSQRLPSMREPSGTGRPSADRALTAHLDELRGELLKRAADARAQAAGSVLALRIVVRRLRNVLRTYRELFLPEVVERFIAALHELHAELGSVRDSEELLAHLPRFVKGCPEIEDVQNAYRELESLLQAELTAAHAGLVGLLDSPAFTGLMDSLARLIEEPLQGDSGHPVHLHVRRRLRRCSRRVVAAFEHAEAASATAGSTRDTTAASAGASAGDSPADSPPDSYETRLHAVRKASKRLRDAAEAAREIYPDDTAAAVRLAKQLQRGLGRHQDQRIGWRIFREMSRQSPIQPASAFILGAAWALRSGSQALSGEEQLAAAEQSVERLGRLRFKG